MHMLQLRSSAFTHGGAIPGTYTCDGENISPPLSIADVPPGAKSLALIMDDPDVPPSAPVSVWDHWVVFNIPPTTAEVGEGKSPEGTAGKNTRGNLGYGGPCPPDREHRYFFTLYALDTTLDLAEGATKREVEDAMQGHVLARAELMGRYNRPGNPA